jgi:hypothetical protein
MPDTLEMRLVKKAKPTQGVALFSIVRDEDYFLPFFFLETCTDLAASTAVAVRLKNHCWAIFTTLPVNQYSTKPLDWV